MRRDPPDLPVTINCDGSCLNNGNNGPGGWAALLEYNNKTKIVKGNTDKTTNNRMELKSAIEGLKALTRPCTVNVYSDSQYLVMTMNEGWKRKANNDLWEELDKEIARHKVSFHWVQGHSGDARNEIVNGIAQEQSKLMKGGSNEIRRESDGTTRTPQVDRNK